jgi:hypothetical protein
VAFVFALAAALAGSPLTPHDIPSRGVFHLSFGTLNFAFICGMHFEFKNVPTVRLDLASAIEAPHELIKDARMDF